MQNRSIDDHRPENKIETFLRITRDLQIAGLWRTKRLNYMVVDLANISFGILGLLGVSFTVVYQFSYLILVCSITLMFMAIVSEAAKKFPVKHF
jgi:hypothetical protein